MKITPLDITQQTFRRKFKGLDAKEVEMFLEVVAVEFEKLVKENKELREKNDEMQKNISEFKEKESELTNALVGAQKFQESLKRNAEKEAEIIIGHAELKGDKIVEEANLRLSKIIREIHELKNEKLKIVSAIKGILDSHYKYLEILSEDDSSNLESNIKFISRINKQ